METFKVYLSTLRQKGYLAYEYNPFYNYQTDVDLYKVTTDVGDILVPKGYAASKKTGRLLKQSLFDNSIYYDEFGNEFSGNDVLTIGSETTLIAKAGSLLDLET